MITRWEPQERPEQFVKVWEHDGKPWAATYRCLPNGTKERYCASEDEWVEDDVFTKGDTYIVQD